MQGSVTLLAGDPGIGKSTLLLHVLGKTGGLYVSGEESAEQIKLRAKRLGIAGLNIIVLPETNAEAILPRRSRKVQPCHWSSLIPFKRFLLGI